MPAVKRKQVDDAMEQSPPAPKRVTRARTTKITTGSVKAVAAAKAAPKAARTNTTAAAAAKQRIVEESAADESMDELEQVEVTAPGKRGRGRPRKDAAPSNTSSNTVKPAATKPAPKTTRTRVTAAKKEPEEEKMTKTTAATRAARGAARAAGKKVTFDDESTHNKENVPLETEKKSASTKTAPIKVISARKTIAKPAAKTTAAKPAAVRGTRGRKLAAKGTDVGETPPLSPKKVTQVAKTSSSSDDELSEKSPIPALQASPKKAPESVRSVIKVATASTLVRPPTPVSPTKVPAASLMQSPAKRPPPSPFKNAIQNSPKKFALPTSPTKTNAAPMQPTFQNSLKVSPKKVNLTIGSGATSASPRRSPFKASLKSPAKRPTSPEKMRLFPSPMKSPSKTPGRVDDTTFKLPTITPRRLFVSPQHERKGNAAAKSPSPVRQSPAKVAFVQYNTNPLDAYKNELAQQGKLSVSDTPRYGAAREDSDSDSEHPTSPSKGFGGGTPTFIFKTPNGKTHRRETMGITPLALKMSTWCATTPEEQPLSPDEDMSATPATLGEEKESSVIRTPRTPGNANFFEAEMSIRQDEPLYEALVEPVTDLHIADAEIPAMENMGQFAEEVENLYPVSDSNDSFIAVDADEGSDDSVSSNDSEMLANDMLEELKYGSPAKDVTYPQLLDAKESQESEEYGDENAIPIDPRILGGSLEEVATEDEVVIDMATPTFPTYRQREIHTVSKVPLRREGPEESLIKVPRKRSKSTTAPLGELPDLVRDGSVLSQALRIMEESNESPSRKVSYETSIINALMTPSKGAGSAHSSPTKSVRAGKESAQILRGAVVYVDVHTSEGADASSIFVELLTQMGARCVKQWTWNPRQSEARGANAAQENTPSGKVGITHVVFKDGGKRTLQKVRDAKGLVLAVGVSWVLDCERENKWLDEAQYAVDTSTIPRGGHNRRKSMEPKMVSNHHGTLVPATTPTKSRYEVTSPSNEFRSFSAASRRSSIRLSPIDASEPQPLPPATPTPYVPDGDETCDLTMCGSPTTPYYLSKGSLLVQQTCPPKQTGQPLFPVTGRIEDQPNEGVRQRLLLARRKSLQWAPKVGSPLGRTVSYER